MDFLEQLKKTAADVAQTVAEKSNEVVEVSKIKYAIHDLSGDVKKLYLELGKLAYEELKESSALTDDMQIKCEIIEAKLAKIDAMRKKEKQIKSVVTCPSCGRECGDSDEKCPYCGADIAVRVDAETDDISDDGEE